MAMLSAQQLRFLYRSENAEEGWRTSRCSGNVSKSKYPLREKVRRTGFWRSTHGFCDSSVLPPSAIYIFNCHLQPALRLIRYIFLCGRACFHLICHNSECPAGLCTTVALHHKPLITGLSTGRFSLLKQRHSAAQWFKLCFFFFYCSLFTHRCRKTTHLYVYLDSQIDQIILFAHLTFTPNLAAFRGLITTVISNLLG